MKPTSSASAAKAWMRMKNLMLSRWVDLLPNGETSEGRGIPPDVLVDEPQSSYADKDPTLERALSLLCEKANKKERKN